jgi:dihydroorotase
MVVERDVQLAALTGGRLHVSRVSTGASVDSIRRAKARGLRVTAEATPHHLLLTDQLVKDSEYDTATKVMPPLRSEADRAALVEGLRDGTLDCIVSDHSPRTVDDKKVEYDLAAFGVSSLETTVALVLDRLVHSGVLEMEQLVGLFSTGPARVLGLPGGNLKPGAPADVTVLDPSRKRQVEPKRFESKGRSTPFAGAVLKGWPVMTVVGGKIAFDAVARK